MRLTSLSLLAFLTLTPLINLRSQICTPQANCTRGDFIDDFEFGNGLISNTNTRGTSCGFPWNPGPSYWLTQLVASVVEDSSYNFSLGAGTVNQYFAIWIDWNRDQDFDDQGEFVYTTSISGSVFNSSIQVPRGAKPGLCTMRVRSRRSSAFLASDACSTVPFGETEDYRLTVRLRYPPQADFSASSTQVVTNCAVQFENTSAGYGSSFSWNFGDGNSSTLEHPTHVYTSSGNYTVQMTITNSVGSDTETKTNYMTVSSSAGPVVASCTPTGSAIAAGFGVTNFSFAGSNASSVDAQSAGYEDFSCSSISVIQGQSYNVSIANSAAAQQNYRVWIDWNGDGFLSNNNELAFSQNNVITGSGSISIPQTAILNTPLRMRIAGVYSLTAPLNNNFDACSNLNNGQIEDRSIVVSPNTNAPVADFSSDLQNSCDGIVQFQDQSSFVPTSWSWDFGDGNSSNQQNPQHSYGRNGVYTVKLTVSNSFGSNQVTKFNFITVNGNNFAKAACAVQTQSHISDYGIYSVSLNTISKSSGGGENGYEDFSCEQNTTLLKQQPYAVGIRTGSSNNEDVSLWIDLNDDGSFSSGELLMTSSNSKFHSDSITIPSSAVSGKALRMRISSDFVGNSNGPCDDVTFGQVEDYSVTISNNPNAVVADFEADSTASCSGRILFSDLSSNNPTAWNWNFGDGNTSTVRNPMHIYSNPGSYTVSLVAIKGSTSDTLTKTAYIVVDPQICTAETIPENSTGTTLTTCGGRIYDSGGKSDYSSNTFGRVTIAPSNSSSVELEFNSFQFGSGDYLKIYDGLDTNSSLIGTYTGTSLSQGSKIIGSSGSLTLVQFSDASINGAGFEAVWSCVKNPSRPTAFFVADSVESCKGFINFSDQSTDNPTSWSWDFGDGGSSSQRNPLHFYSNQGKYNVRLIASNSLGSDTLIRTQYINVNNIFCFPDAVEELNQPIVKIFPNPSKGVLNVQLSGLNSDATVQVFDLKGQMIRYRKGIVNESIRFDLHELSSGIYLVRIQLNEFTHQEKIHIE